MTDSAKQRKNSGLKPWKPGQSGNPKGRPPKGLAIADILRAQAEEIDPETKKTRLQTMLEVAWAQAQGGDKDARKFVADRMEGLARQFMEITNKETVEVEEIIVPRRGGNDQEAG